ncbi:MAG: hypothetical protein WAT79_01880 [Saprospiraceae bacterium]
MKYTLILSVLYMVFICNVYGQHVGINTSSPQLSLDIEGGFAHRSVVIDPISNHINVPQDVSFIVVSPVGVTGQVTVTDVETFINGRRLVIYNNSGYPVIFENNQIETSAIKEFICRGPSFGWSALTPSGSNFDWKTSGNDGTDPDVQFIGTSDDQELSFRTNLIERMRLTNEGLRIRDGFNLELGHGIVNKPYGNGSFNYNLFGPFPSLDIFGAGNDFTGYDRRITFHAQGGSSFTGGAQFGGNISLNGEIQPFGNQGEQGQVLTSQGSGQMSWSFPDKEGQIIEVSPYTTDTSALSAQGYTLMGSQNRTIQKTTASGGLINPLLNWPQVNPYDHLIYSTTDQKIYVVKSGTIFSISLAEVGYGTVTNITVPSFNLDNTIPIFTGSKILIYPHFIFDCATNTTTNFPTNPCTGFTVTTEQVWTGTLLIIYGPNGGITFNPTSNIFTCIETSNGNLYYPQSRVIWTGSKAIFYGGYIVSMGDTISVDIGIEYNPSTNSWSDLPAGGPRIHNHQMLWTDTEVMMLGGRTDENNSMNGINFYNPVSFLWNDGWVPGTGEAYITKYFKAQRINNKVFFFNTLNIDYLPNTYSAYYFDLTTKANVSFTSFFRNSRHLDYTATVVVGNDIYFFPRYQCLGDQDDLHFFAIESNPVYIYPKFNANIVTTVAKKIASSGNYLLVFGMFNGGLNYEVSKNRWRRTPTFNQPSDREGHVSLSVGTNKILLWGGKTSTTYHNTGAIYDAALNTWSAISTANAPSARTKHTAAYGGGKVLVWGGNAGGGYLNNGKLYDVNTNTWANVSTIGAPSCSTHAYIDWNGTEFFVYCNGVQKYNPTTNTWQFVYPNAESNDFSSSGLLYQINISGKNGKIYQKSNNLHYQMDGNGLEFIGNQTHFINEHDIFLPGIVNAQLYNTVQKDFKFINMNYYPLDITFNPHLQYIAPDQFLLIDIRPERQTTFSCNWARDALMVLHTNVGLPITRDINIETLLYRK